MKKILQTVLFVGMLVFACQSSFGQRVALRTNVLDWATLSPNLSLETRLSGRFTLGLGLSGSPVKVTVMDTRFNSIRFQPELRYWFNRPMAKHYMGLALLASNFDLKHKTTLQQGDIFAAGLTYGYALVLGRHWNVEFTAGVGVGPARYFDYLEHEDKPSSPNVSKLMIIPMNIGVSFTYIFK